MSSQLTRRAIAESLIKLLNDKPLDKITVKNVVEECGINRNTFYYHYRDIYDLVEDILNHEAEKVIKEYKEPSNWVEGFIQSAQFALNNKKALYHIYNSVERNMLERYLFRVSKNVMLTAVKSHADGLDVAQEDIQYIAMFYMHAIVGMIFDWLQDGMKVEPEPVIRRLGEIFDGNIRYTLEKISKRNTGGSDK